MLVLAAAFLGEALIAAKVLALGLGLAEVRLIALPAIADPDAYPFSGPLLALRGSASLAVGNVIFKAISDNLDTWRPTGIVGGAEMTEARTNSHRHPLAFYLRFHCGGP